MPSNENGSAQVICPYFRERGAMHVCCESLVNGASTRLIFPTRDAMKAYTGKYCRTYNWGRCRQAEALDNLYDDDGRRV